MNCFIKILYPNTLLTQPETDLANPTTMIGWAN